MDEDEDFQESTNSYLGNYSGRCFTCGDVVPIKELIKIDYNGKVWYICECCHIAFWHGGYSPLQIGKELEETEKKRVGHPARIELSDPRRNSKKKISLEEIADFMYWMYREESGIINKIL